MEGILFVNKTIDYLFAHFNTCSHLQYAIIVLDVMLIAVTESKGLLNEKSVFSENRFTLNTTDVLFLL